MLFVYLVSTFFSSLCFSLSYFDPLVSCKCLERRSNNVKQKHPVLQQQTRREEGEGTWLRHYTFEASARMLHFYVSVISRPELFSITLWEFS